MHFVVYKSWVLWYNDSVQQKNKTQIQYYANPSKRND